MILNLLFSFDFHIKKEISLLRERENNQSEKKKENFFPTLFNLSPPFILTFASSTRLYARHTQSLTVHKMKGDFNCSGTEDNLDIVHGSCLPLLQRFSRVFSRVLCNVKKKGREGRMGRGLQTQARASLSKQRVRLWTFLSRKEGGSFLPPRVRKESGTERDRARKMLVRTG